MKKTLIISTIAAAAMSLTGCNMDLRPEGSIDPDNALLSIDDADRLRDGLYIAFRGRVGGAFAYLDEIRSDLFHASVSFGNNGGTMYNWIWTSADSDVSGIWSNSYYAIANANFFIEAANAVNTSEWSEEDRENLQIWKGEAFFVRAYFHLELAEAFCLDYPGHEQSYGVPYVTVYNPTSDNSRYPNRGTLEETFSNILADLDSAAAYVTTPGSVGSMWVTADAVTALRARTALEMGDYSSVIDLVSEDFLMRYPLVTSEEAFQRMWINDDGSECILQFDASYPNELGTSYDMGYIGYNATEGIYSPTYLPEQWVVDLFQQYPEDWRNTNHMIVRELNIGGTPYNLASFTKFPGNPALRQAESDQNYQHKAKPFRIAEMYLVLAEAYARSSQMQQAANYLTRLRQGRIPGYVQDFQAGEVLSEIQDERVRELMGEGFRIQDLKRFGEGVQRHAAQNSSTIYMPSNNEDFFRDASDFRMIFPIPQEEIDANPQIAGEQNPQY